MNRAAHRLFACLALIALLPARAVAQQPSPEFLKGTHAFRFVLHDLHFTPLKEFRDLFDQPSRNILIVLGDTSEVDEFQGSVVRAFVEAGGALLVATDHPVSPRRRIGLTWAGEFGIEVVGQPVLGPSQVCYQGFKECPLVWPSESGKLGLFDFLKHRVATNLPGFLRVTRSKSGKMLSEQAMLPPGCQSPHANRPMERAGFLPFAAGSDWGAGRVLVLADHSVFINNMMLQSDTGNVDFTYNCLEWLRSGGEQKRDQVLFYDDGQIVENFNVPVKMPPPGLPEIDDPVALADKLIAGLEDENMHNRMLLDWIDHDRLLKFLAIAGTLVLAVGGLMRLMRARHRHDATAPLLGPTLARLAPAGVGLGQRHKALLAEGNLWEPARALAREFFDSALGVPEPPTPPAFQANESWLTRRALHKQVLRLWQLAHGPALRITPAEFTRLAAQVDEMRAALADGTLRFTS